jgi:dihydrofolate reductase
MRKLVVVNMMSLDGFYEGPGGDVTALPFEDGRVFNDYNLERMKAAGTVLLGARSYAVFREYWPPIEKDPAKSASEREFSRLYNAIDKVVVSDHATLPSKGHPWATTTRIVERADARAEIGKLKRENGKEIVMWGSRTLWHDLITHGLVDELHLFVGAAVLGDGTPLFQNHTAPLRRLETRVPDGSNNVLVCYAVPDGGFGSVQR